MTTQTSNSLKKALEIILLFSFAATFGFLLAFGLVTYSSNRLDPEVISICTVSMIGAFLILTSIFGFRLALEFSDVPKI